MIPEKNPAQHPYGGRKSIQQVVQVICFLLYSTESLLMFYTNVALFGNTDSLVSANQLKSGLLILRITVISLVSFIQNL